MNDNPKSKGGGKLHGCYILVDGKPVLEPDPRKFDDWYQDIANRRVGKTKVGNRTVSTVFLAIDHNFGTSLEPEPVLWETMVFPDDSSEDEACYRYTSVESARAGHEAIVKELQDGPTSD